MNEQAKQAALSHINSKIDFLIKLYLDANKKYLVGGHLKDAERTVNKYGFDKAVYSELLIKVYDGLMKGQHFSEAESFAGKYLNPPNKSEADKATSNLNLELIISAIFTIICGVGLLLVMMYSFDFGWLISLLVAVIYSLIHPYLGRLFFEIAFIPAKIIDDVFNLKNNKSWTSGLTGNSIIFSAVWPIFGIPYIVIGFLAAIFGSIYKSFSE